MEEVKACSKCTSWRHQKSAKQCPRGTSSCTALKSGKKCDKDHDTSLHGSGNKYCSTAGLMSATASNWKNKTCEEDEGFSPVLLEIQQVPLIVEGLVQETTLFFENGTTATICTHRWARSLGLT